MCQWAVSAIHRFEASILRRSRRLTNGSNLPNVDNHHLPVTANKHSICQNDFGGFVLYYRKDFIIFLFGFGASTTSQFNPHRIQPLPKPLPILVLCPQGGSHPPLWSSATTPLLVRWTISDKLVGVSSATGWRLRRPSNGVGAAWHYVVCSRWLIKIPSLTTLTATRVVGPPICHLNRYFM